MSNLWEKRLKDRDKRLKVLIKIHTERGHTKNVTKFKEEQKEVKKLLEKLEE